LKAGKTSLKPVHIETLQGLFTNLKYMKGFHNFIAENISDEDPKDILGKIVE